MQTVGALFLRAIQVDLYELMQLLASKIACSLMGRDRSGDSDNAIAGQNRTNVGYEQIISRFLSAVVFGLLLDMQFLTEPTRQCLPRNNLGLISLCRQCFFD